MTYWLDAKPRIGTGGGAHFKKAAEHAAKIVLIDETGILMCPLVRRCLARRGEPMVVRYQSKHRQKISVQGTLVPTCVVSR